MRLGRAAAVAVTAGLLGGAVAIGGGHPLSPASVARAAREAAHNTDVAVRNISRAAGAARSLAVIEDHVVQQLRAKPVPDLGVIVREPLSRRDHASAVTSGAAEQEQLAATSDDRGADLKSASGKSDADNRCNSFGTTGNIEVGPRGAE